MVTIMVLLIMAIVGACIIALFTAALPALLDIAVTIGLIVIVVKIFKRKK